MSKPKKRYLPFSCRMDEDTYTNLENFCQEYGMTKTAVVERAINMYIANTNERMAVLQSIEGPRPKK